MTPRCLNRQQKASILLWQEAHGIVKCTRRARLDLEEVEDEPCASWSGRVFEMALRGCKPVAGQFNGATKRRRRRAKRR